MESLQLHIVAEQEVLGKEFRIYGSVNDPLFLAKDVANWIEHSDVSMMLKRIDNDEKVTNNVCTPGGTQNAWFLTENGMYEILMQSRKAIAKQFKKEVKIILKTIRQTGGFVANSDAFVDAYFGGIDTSLKPVLSAMLEASRQQTELINQQAIKLVEKEKLINVLEPKASYTDLVLKSARLVSVTQIAKDYGMSGQEMNTLLHTMQIQYKKGKQWLLYAKHAKEGYVGSDTFAITHSNGIPDSVMNTKWTQKGRLFIYELLKLKGIIPILERQVVIADV